jgi:hypothetical protein
MSRTTQNRLAITAYLLLLAPVPLPAGTLTGTVRNGTTGAPAANQEVVLLELQSGMQVIATTRTDSRGRFLFSHPAVGTVPLLVRAQYQGANYHQNVPPDAQSADIEIFESTTDSSAFQVASRFIVLQPNGPVLLVGEEFLIENRTRPPVTVYRPDGSFEFVLPEGADLSQVSAWGPAGMPVVQGTITKGTNRYAIAFPIRPGESGVRISYQLPYAEARATLRLSSLYGAGQILVAAPPSVRIAGAEFQPAGSEQGFNLYSRQGLARGTTFEISLSGTAIVQQTVGETDSAGGAGSSRTVRMMPPRIDSLKWVLLAGFGALFALGAFYLVRKPSVQAAQLQARVHNQVSESLEEIKDTLFRLELRRQAGTISAEEFDREYRRAQERLRGFLKG